MIRVIIVGTPYRLRVSNRYDTSLADIVPLEKRGVYQGWIGGTWGIAAALGPILGGLLTEKASWYAA